MRATIIDAARSVFYVGHDCMPCKYGWTASEPDWGVDSREAKEARDE